MSNTSFSSIFPGFVDTTAASPAPTIGVGGLNTSFFSQSQARIGFTPPGIVSAGGSGYLYDEMRNGGTGVAVNNFHPINTTFVAEGSATFPMRNAHRQDMVFIDRYRKGVYTGLKINFEVASIGALNAYLVTPEGREKYGVDTSCTRLLEDFAFSGVLQTEMPEYKPHEMEATTTVARRARCNAITRACSLPTNRIADHHGDKHWFVVCRRKLTLAQIAPGVRSVDQPTKVDEIEEEDAGPVTEITNPHYWQLHLFSKTTEPAPWLYTDKESKGAAMLIGTTIDVEDANTRTKAEATDMQNAISGVYNTFVEEKAHNRLLERSRPVDIFLGS
jgi:hypothetical protein